MYQLGLCTLYLLGGIHYGFPLILFPFVIPLFRSPPPSRGIASRSHFFSSLAAAPASVPRAGGLLVAKRPPEVRLAAAPLGGDPGPMASPVGQLLALLPKQSLQPKPLRIEVVRQGTQARHLLQRLRVGACNGYWAAAIGKQEHRQKYASKGKPKSGLPGK